MTIAGRTGWKGHVNLSVIRNMGMLVCLCVAVFGIILGNLFPDFRGFIDGVIDIFEIFIQGRAEAKCSN
jgi:hypothetical protein